MFFFVLLPLQIVFYLEGRGDWSSRGCVVVNETADEVTCQCDHLTSFSILLVSLLCTMVPTWDKSHLFESPNIKAG